LSHSSAQLQSRQRPRLRYALSHFEPIVCEGALVYVLEHG
jgi:hypothetical protein